MRRPQQLAQDLGLEGADQVLRAGVLQGLGGQGCALGQPAQQLRVEIVGIGGLAHQ